MKIQYLPSLLFQFIITEIIAGIELAAWLLIKETDFYQMLWNTSYVRPAMALALVAIPVISALKEYDDNEKQIKLIVRNLKS